MCISWGTEEAKETRLAEQGQLRDSGGRGRWVGPEVDIKSWRPQRRCWAGPEHCRRVWLEGLHRLLGERAAPAWGRAEKSSSERSGRMRGKAWWRGKCAVVASCVCVCTHARVPVWVCTHPPGAGASRSDLSLSPANLAPVSPHRLVEDMTVTVRRAQCCNCISSRTRGHQRLAESPVCARR